MTEEIAIRTAGRPTKYDPAFIDAVILDGSLGFSLTAFAGGIGVDRTTISEWRKVHPEFDFACRHAMAIRARFLEGGMMERDIPAPAMNARKFALVNCAPDDWREKTNLELTGADGGPVKTEAVVDWSGVPSDAIQAVLDAVQKDAK